MEKNFINNDDAVRAENEFLKMKMMIERGAQFSGASSGCTPEMENQFLKYIMEFEKLSENPKRIRLYDKINCPSHFPPSNEIDDASIDAKYGELIAYLNQFDINVSVCSPNISRRELYRFITEELFNEEIEDISMPGLVTDFIYDLYHPDPVYDNLRCAVDECIAAILSDRPAEWMHLYRHEKLQLNDHYLLTAVEFRAKLDNFKSNYRNIRELAISGAECRVESPHCFVMGYHCFEAEYEGERRIFEGKWLVNFEYDSITECWYIFSVEIGGVHFE